MRLLVSVLASAGMVLVKVLRFMPSAMVSMMMVLAVTVLLIVAMPPVLAPVSIIFMQPLQPWASERAVTRRSGIHQRRGGSCL